MPHVFKHPHWSKVNLSKTQIRRTKCPQREIFLHYEYSNKPVSVTIKQHGNNKIAYQILLKKKAIGAVTKLTYAKLVDYRDNEEISDKCRA